ETSMLEGDAAVLDTFRRIWIDADRVVPARAQLWNEATVRTAADLQDARRRRRQPPTHARPHRLQPSRRRRRHARMLRASLRKTSVVPADDDPALDSG